jgi:hypothetical protein
LEQGIDIDAPSSVEGAFGRAGVNIFRHDPTATEQEQQSLLRDNIAITCAGAASDARLTGRTLREALRRQPGDQRAAMQLLEASPLVQLRDREEVYQLLLNFTEELVNKPEIWNAIEQVAQACLDEGGQLSRAQIEAILLPLFEDGQ